METSLLYITALHCSIETIEKELWRLATQLAQGVDDAMENVLVEDTVTLHQVLKILKNK